MKAHLWFLSQLIAMIYFVEGVACVLQCVCSHKPAQSKYQRRLGQFVILVHFCCSGSGCCSLVGEFCGKVGWESLLDPTPQIQKYAFSNDLDLAYHISYMTYIHVVGKLCGKVWGCGCGGLWLWLRSCVAPFGMYHNRSFIRHLTMLVVLTNHIHVQQISV